MNGASGAMPDRADNLLKLVKDAVAIISVYKGDLVRDLHHRYELTCDLEGFGIALEEAKVTRWWLERAARLLDGESLTLLDQCLAAIRARAPQVALDDQTRKLLDLYVQSTDEVRGHIALTIAATRKDNIRLRRRLRMLQSGRRRPVESRAR